MPACLWTTPTPAAETGDAVFMELRRFLMAAMLCLLALSGCSAMASRSVPAQVVSQPGSAPGQLAAPASHWAGVLTRLDRRRALAYVSADPRSLRSVYAPASTVLRRDRAMLRAYSERGISLSGVRLDLLAVHLIDRGSRWVRLRVVDRLRRPTAHAPRATMLLPQDQPTRWLIGLRRNADGWRIANVHRRQG